MELQHLQEFVVLANKLNYALAAEETFTTPSTLSRHIATMEKELGGILFDRTTRMVSLTEFGNEFLPYAAHIVQIWHECTAHFLHKNTGAIDTVVVAIPEPVLHGEPFLQDAISDFIRNFPEYQLIIRRDIEPNQISTKINTNECDIAIIREPLNISNSSLCHLRISEVEPVLLLMPINHPLAKTENIALESLQDECFLLPPSTTFTYQLFLTRCRQLGFEPNVRPTQRSRDLSISMVKSGCGISVLSNLPHGIGSDPGVSVASVYPPINQALYLVRPMLSKLSPATEAFCKIFEKYFK